MRAGRAVGPRAALTKYPIAWNHIGGAVVVDDVSTPNTLSTDFSLMHAVAAKTDARNEEIRAMLAAFIGRVSCVPPTVWSGLAATRFKDVVQRWNTESMKLYHALHGIAESIRYNEATLREAGQNHAHRIGTVGAHL